MIRMSAQTVSVVIPCYNAASFLREALESALAQTHPPDEVIVVDDGSTDNSADIAGAFGLPVRVIRQANQGESVARNRGIEEARSEWVAFLDADDVWRPTKLERQLAASSSEIVCVHTNYFVFGSIDGLVDHSLVPPEVRYRIEDMSVRNVIHASSLLVRRAVPVRFPVWTRYAEDLVYCLDLLRHGEIRLVPDFLTGYRRHPRSQSSAPAVESAWHRTVETWLDMNRDWLPEGTVLLVRRRWLLKLAREARGARWQRDWARYWALREYLGGLPELPETRSVLDERILPRWLYALWDILAGPAARRRPSRGHD
jgi:glycosyltransferase involved in cell wall biosynthesis